MLKPDTTQRYLAGGKQSYKSENIQDPNSCFIGNTLVSKDLAGMMQKQLGATLLPGIREANTAQPLLLILFKIACLGILLRSQKMSEI